MKTLFALSVLIPVFLMMGCANGLTPQIKSKNTSTQPDGNFAQEMAETKYDINESELMLRQQGCPKSSWKMIKHTAFEGTLYAEYTCKTYEGDNYLIIVNGDKIAVLNKEINNE